MASYGHAHDLDDEDEHVNHVNYAWVILAAVLCGVGITMTLLWLIQFQWMWFPGVGVATIGFLLLFDRRAGLDRAE